MATFWEDYLTRSYAKDNDDSANSLSGIWLIVVVIGAGLVLIIFLIGIFYSSRVCKSRGKRSFDYDDSKRGPAGENSLSASSAPNYRPLLDT